MAESCEVRVSNARVGLVTVAFGPSASNLEFGMLTKMHTNLIPFSSLRLVKQASDQQF